MICSFCLEPTSGCLWTRYDDEYGAICDRCERKQVCQDCGESVLVDVRLIPTNQPKLALDVDAAVIDGKPICGGCFSVRVTGALAGGAR